MRWYKNENSLITNVIEWKRGKERNKDKNNNLGMKGYNIFFKTIKLFLVHKNFSNAENKTMIVVLNIHFITRDCFF